MEPEATPRMSEGTNSPLEEQMEELNTLLQRVQHAATEQARTADRMVRQYPYAAIGIAAGLGLVIGLLASRR